VIRGVNVVWLRIEREESVGCCDSPWPTASRGNRENPLLFPFFLFTMRTYSQGACKKRCILRASGGLALQVRLGLPHNGRDEPKRDMTTLPDGTIPVTTKSAAYEWDGFLHRQPLALDREQTAASIAGKRILVTGAGGWIGSALTRSIAEFAPRQMVLLEAAERNLYEINAALQRLSRPIEHVPVLGSVLHPVLLAEIFRRYRPQIVYHAAAYKHVPLMEQNPFAAIENNAIGTSLLVEAAQIEEMEQLILLSTDKAVDPVSIMGASKRIAELVVLTRRTQGILMKAVRLGNVLGSEGSIVPLFLKQMLSGLPVTVTHPDVRRYFLTTADAVTLLLQASHADTAPGILAPDLAEPLRVEALARHLMAKVQTTSTLVFTELRPGDKMCEALLSARESFAMNPGEERALRLVKSPCLAPAMMDDVLEQLQQACQARSLDRLFKAVLRAVPEYQPSALMQTAVEETA
jgi:FlaA1/EpsC-like NDP-sugar epimerase